MPKCQHLTKPGKALPKLRSHPYPAGLMPKPHPGLLGAPKLSRLLSNSGYFSLQVINPKKKMKKKKYVNSGTVSSAPCHNGGALP